MKVNDYIDFKIVILETSEEDVSLILNSYDENDLIYVPMVGYMGDDLSSDRFLITSHKDSFHNHMLWEGLFDSEEQEDYIESCCRKFWETGKQMIVENYEYQEDEPFYDYSK